MTKRQARALEGFAEEAEQLALALHESPEVDDPDTEAALLELADHHLAVAEQVERFAPQTVESALIESMLASDANELTRIETDLDEAERAAARAARHREQDGVLAVAATAVLILVGGLIGGLVVMAGPLIW